MSNFNNYHDIIFRFQTCMKMHENLEIITYKINVDLSPIFKYVSCTPSLMMIAFTFEWNLKHLIFKSK